MTFADLSCLFRPFVLDVSCCRAVWTNGTWAPGILSFQSPVTTFAKICSAARLPSLDSDEEDISNPTPQGADSNYPLCCLHRSSAEGTKWDAQEVAGSHPSSWSQLFLHRFCSCSCPCIVLITLYWKIVEDNECSLPRCYKLSTGLEKPTV